MTDKVIEERYFATADALWAHLVDPSAFHRRDGWAFRGHGNSTWELVPKAHREGTLDEFLSTDERALWLGGEHELLKKFVFAADDAGLWTGAALSYLRRFGDAPPDASGVWPPDALEEALALAQHYGLPTRLLDWTPSATTAAYFAASQALGLMSKGKVEGDSAVWAFRVALAESIGPMGYRKLIRVVRPAKATNPNLNAQRGLFSLLKDVSQTPMSLERFVELVASPGSLVKLTFPTAEAPRLSQIIAEVAHVSGSSVYPGYGGVTESIREAALRERLLKQG